MEGDGGLRLGILSLHITHPRNGEQVWFPRLSFHPSDYPHTSESLSESYAGEHDIRRLLFCDDTQSVARESHSRNLFKQACGFRGVKVRMMTQRSPLPRAGFSVRENITTHEDILRINKMIFQSVQDILADGTLSDRKWPSIAGPDFDYSERIRVDRSRTFVEGGGTRSIVGFSLTIDSDS